MRKLIGLLNSKLYQVNSETIREDFELLDLVKLALKEYHEIGVDTTEIDKMDMAIKEYVNVKLEPHVNMFENITGMVRSQKMDKKLYDLISKLKTSVNKIDHVLELTHTIHDYKLSQLDKEVVLSMLHAIKRDTCYANINKNTMVRAAMKIKINNLK